MSWVTMHLYAMQSLAQLQNAQSGFFANQQDKLSLLDKAGEFVGMGMDYMKSPKFGDFMKTAMKSEMDGAQLQTQMSVLDAQYKKYQKYLEQEFARESKGFNAVG